jgi:PIN domain nuclease of toxin-antitoxin system
VIILDTQALVWLLFDDRRLGKKTHHAIAQAWAANEAAVSAITFWDVARLHDKGRLTILLDIGTWRESLLAEGLIEIPVNGAIGIRAASLSLFHGDPADRLIVATALEGHRLITADERILAWPGNLDRLRATE